MFWIFRNIRCLSLLHQSQLLSLCTAWVFIGAILPVQAQSVQALGAWQLSAGWQDYSESQMNLKGPELGVHWQSQKLGPFTFEANAHLGLQNYSSVQSGRLNSVLNVDTHWLALRASTAQPQWQFGLALHNHANFFRGTTSLGFGGYDRLSTQVWLPVRSALGGGCRLAFVGRACFPLVTSQPQFSRCHQPTAQGRLPSNQSESQYIQRGGGTLCTLDMGGQLGCQLGDCCSRTCQGRL